VRQAVSDHLCASFPFIAVLIHDGLSIKCCGLLLQLPRGTSRRIYYGIYQVTATEPGRHRQ